MKPIPAIIEPAHDVVLAAVRKSFSELREAEAQVSKLEKRTEDARGAAEMRRRECGRSLVKARELWPSSRALKGGARGPGGLTWVEYLEREGIAESTAYRYMESAGWTPSSVTDSLVAEPDIQPRETASPPILRVVPSTSDDPDFDPVPQPPAPLPRPGFNLKLGDWRSVLIDAGTVDAVICDPPYGERAHSSKAERNDGSDPDGLSPDYPWWTPEDVAFFVKHWSPRTRGWMVALTSHDLIPAWEAAYEAVGRYSFQPVPCVIQGMSVRLCGDGPSSWAVYAMVGRPRSGEFSRWGTLPGAYTGGSQAGSEGGRGKPSWLMRAIVGHYSRPGDLICDPLAGYGATLLAALDEGRRCIGAELDHGAYDEAYRRAAIPRETDESTNTDDERT